MKLALKHAITAIILMLRFPTPGGAGPLEDADAAIKRRDYATAVRLIRPSPYSVTYLKRAVIARDIARGYLNLPNQFERNGCKNISYASFPRIRADEEVA
jgi:hypothetical protein